MQLSWEQNFKQNRLRSKGKTHPLKFCPVLSAKGYTAQQAASWFCRGSSI